MKEIKILEYAPVEFAELDYIVGLDEVGIFKDLQ